MVEWEQSSDVPASNPKADPPVDATDASGLHDGVGISSKSGPVDLGQAVNDLKALVEEISARNEALERDNLDLRRDVEALAALSRPRSLDDVDGVFKTRSYDDSMLAGACGVGRLKHLIIPIHPPKIAHVSNIFSRVDSQAESQDVLLTFITTTAVEREIVERYIALTKPNLPMAYEVISVIELAEALGMNLLAAEASRTEAAIINIKKLMGLYRSLYLGASEVVSMDSDALFLKTADDLFCTAARNYERKTFFAAFSPIEITELVVKACSNYYLEDETRRLRALMGPDLFSWFFDAPYYQGADASEFLAHVCLVHGGMERAMLALTWHTFDHVLFINHLLLRGDFQLVDVRGIVTAGRITDDLSLTDLRAVEAGHGYRPVWAPLPAMISASEAGIENQFVVALHVDRVSTASTTPE